LTGGALVGHHLCDGTPARLAPAVNRVVWTLGGQVVGDEGKEFVGAQAGDVGGGLLFADMVLPSVVVAHQIGG
jgi:hypothetical protein